MIIAIYNVKGGTNKTTTALNLASLLNPHYVIDLDDHESINTLNNLRVKPFEMPTFNSSRELASFLISHKEDKSIIIDCGGFDSEKSAIAIKAAHLVIVPTTETALDIRGLMHTSEAIERVNVPGNVWVIPNGVHYNKKHFHKLKGFCDKSETMTLRDDLKIRALEEVNGAAWRGLGIYEHNKHCGAARDYKALATAIMNEGRKA